MDSEVDGRAIAKRIAFFLAFAILVGVAVATLPGIGEVRDRFADADMRWIAVTAFCAAMSMLGYVRTLWAAFDRVVPWRRALVLGLAEQGRTSCCPPAARAGPRSARTS